MVDDNDVAEEEDVAAAEAVVTGITLTVVLVAVFDTEAEDDGVALIVYVFTDVG